MRSIAFDLFGGASWFGGARVLENTATALRQRFGSDVILWLVIDGSDANAVIDHGRSSEQQLIRVRRPRRWTPWWALSATASRLWDQDLVVELAMRRRGVEVEFGPALARRWVTIPTLAWLPDFQHVHLPMMFSDKERQGRDISFRRCAQRAGRVILPSLAARRDFERFAPKWGHKARTLRPIAEIPESTYTRDPREVSRHYSLPDRFIYLPNQFWKHKNHEVVFEALVLLKRANMEVVVVCSGYCGDSRHPDHVGELWRKVAEWDIRDRVIYLGMISHADVLSLMRQSLCVVNPSRFEGWALTVDEARSVGKLVVVSDIPAHREQDPPGAIWFNPADPHQLANLLGKAWREETPGPDRPREDEARESLPARRKQFADAFMQVVEEVVG